MSPENTITDDEAFRRAARKKGPVGFSDEDGIDNGLTKIAEVIGRKTRVTTNEGKKVISAKATIVRTSEGIIATIPGGESQIISINVDKAGKILPENLMNDLKKDLEKNRKRRKENIGAR